MNRFADVDSAESVVFQAIGAGSTCWENMSGTGVFDSTEAKAIGDEAMARLREFGLPETDEFRRTGSCSRSFTELASLKPIDNE